MALNLGTRDQPIHIDFPSNELRHTRPPEFSVAATSLSLPQRPVATLAPLNSQGKPLHTTRRKVKTVLSPVVGPTVCNESLIAEPMTTHSQDVAQSLKRKRVNAEETLGPELAKRLKKSEKKRRKRERRAARIAQLGNNISSLHSPSTPLNVDLQPGPSHRSPDPPSRGPVLQDVPLAIAKFRPECSTPESLLSVSSLGSHCQQTQSEMRPGGDALQLNGECIFSSNSQIPLSTTIPSGPVPDPLSSSMDEEASDILPDQVTKATKTPTTQFTPTTSSLLNRRIRERMALLIEHQRLANGGDSLPPVPLHRTINHTASTLVGDTISEKQNTLDRAISENKAALAQLGAPRSKEEKLVLMKAVTQRNKLITQLTNEIKTHLDSMRSRMVQASTPSPPERSVMRFKWPETEFPLCLVISNDDDADSAA